MNNIISTRLQLGLVELVRVHNRSQKNLLILKYAIQGYQSAIRHR